jgi:organic radical activating enzyme
MFRTVKFESITQLKKNKNPLIIFALTEESEALAFACKENGINVSAFCDNEIRKTGKKLHDIEIIYTPDLPKKYPNASFLIAHHTLDDCAEQLSDLGYDDFYSPLELFKNYKVDNYSYRTSTEYMRKKIENAMKINQIYFDDTKTYLRSLDIVITTKCSMKCESCANLMQYYKNASSTDDKILEAVKRVSDNVDHISEYRIIGGEPLMNKNWAKITKSIFDQDPTRTVYIYSNATICPKESDLDLIKDKNIYFYITDYDELSKNMDSTIKTLEKNNIPYFRKPAGNWVDCSQIRKHNRTPKRLKQVFKECCAKFIFTILSGKLYTCPFIANADQLKAIPMTNADYVDLLDKSDEKIKAKITKLVKMKNFFPACDFCDGRPHDPANALEYAGKGLIKAGKQVPKGQTLPFENLK